MIRNFLLDKLYAICITKHNCKNNGPDNSYNLCVYVSRNSALALCKVCIFNFKDFIVISKTWYIIWNKMSAEVRLKPSQVNNRSATHK